MRRAAGGLSLIGTIALAGFWRRLSPTVEDALGVSGPTYLLLCFVVGSALVGGGVGWVRLQERRSRRRAQ